MCRLQANQFSGQHCDCRILLLPVTMIIIDWVPAVGVSEHFGKERYGGIEKKMNRKSIITASLFSLIFIIWTNFEIRASQEPEWAIENSYTYDIQIDGSANFEQGNMELTLTADDVVYEVVDFGIRSFSHGSMATHEVYIVSFSGSGFASGTADITEPVQLNAPVEIRNALYEGEMWITTEGLATAKIYRHIAGECWIKPFFAWQYAGPVDLWENEEYDPPLQDVQFPASVGDEWEDDLILYAFGQISAYLEIYGIPFYINEPFDQSQNFTLQAENEIEEWKNQCWSYRIFHDDFYSNASERYWYCPEALWFSAKNLQQITVSGSGLNIESLDMNLTSYSVVTPTPYLSPTPGPTGSATPEVTSTPSSTSTSTVTPTCTSQPSKTPDETPAATLTPEDTAPTNPPVTPTAGPSPEPGTITVDLMLNQELFYAGDTFLLRLKITNNKADMTLLEFILLDVYGAYWYYDGWTEQVDYVELFIPFGYDQDETILEFEWPPDTGAADDIRFWSALVNPVGMTLVSNVDSVVFSYR